MTFPCCQGLGLFAEFVQLALELGEVHPLRRGAHLEQDAGDGGAVVGDDRDDQREAGEVGDGHGSRRAAALIQREADQPGQGHREHEHRHSLLTHYLVSNLDGECLFDARRLKPQAFAGTIVLCLPLSILDQPQGCFEYPPNSSL